jgi:hypothetical protein
VGTALCKGLKAPMNCEEGRLSCRANGMRFVVSIH